MADWCLHCDESSTTDRYLVLGGILIRAADEADLCQRIDRWRSKRGLVGEIGWKKTTQSRLSRYMEFAKGTIGHSRSGVLSYRCTVFDREDDALFRGVSKVDAYVRKMRQFIIHNFAMHLSEGDRLTIYPDEEFLQCDPASLACNLNEEISFRRGSYSASVVGRIAPVPSEDSHFVQMADILSGAVAAGNNKAFDPNSKRGQAKLQLSEYVRELAGVYDFRKSTFGRPDFKIWHFVPVMRAMMNRAQEKTP